VTKRQRLELQAALGDKTIPGLRVYVDRKTARVYMFSELAPRTTDAKVRELLQKDRLLLFLSHPPHP